MYRGVKVESTLFETEGSPVMYRGVLVEFT